MYSIRTFAQLTGVTMKALRHYERVGLLMPGRTRARYRQYSFEDLRRLEHVLALKSLGLPLRAIKPLLKEPGVPLRAHREALEDRRARLDRAIDALRQIEQHPRPSDALKTFIGEAAWDRWETERQKRASTAPRAPDRASPSRIELFREIEAALGEDPGSARARQLAREYRETIEPGTLEALKHRATWPSGMRSYVASLFGATPDSWERVAAFLEASDHA